VPGKRAVFLDRDGVINQAVVRDGKPYPPSGVDELKVVAGAAEALRDLKHAGFLLIVATNQPDIARGTQSRATVDVIHHALRETLPLDDFFVCPHDDSDQCGCRKPLPGLLLRAAEKYHIDMSRSFMVGDRWRDVDAGASAGAKVDSIRAAADWILRQP
jgi:D-glycero-D-manno-heptose 1,7-bisphosphate phosphatase